MLRFCWVMFRSLGLLCVFENSLNQGATSTLASQLYQALKNQQIPQ